MEAYFDREAGEHDDLFVRRMGMTEFYDEVERQMRQCPENRSILVLGCGTGLEIERIDWEAEVTAVDLSQGMIDALRRKTFYPGVALSARRDSLLTMDYGKDRYGLIVSCYVMHHFNEKQKRDIYGNIARSLLPSGVFLCGDTVEKDPVAEQKRLAEAEALYAERGLPFASLHIDVPFRMERERAVLSDAGLTDVTIAKEWTNTVLYRARKG